jgi:hypothetical protein
VAPERQLTLGTAAKSVPQSVARDRLQPRPRLSMQGWSFLAVAELRPTGPPVQLILASPPYRVSSVGGVRFTLS